MSEGILLAPLDRGTLLPESERLARLEAALPQIGAAVAGESDAVAVMATLACLFWQTLVQTNWCGFYRRVGERELAVGPYQGNMGCLRIPFDKGVCGACARDEILQLVPDTQAFPGHIACDEATRSELVLPIFDSSGRLRGVFDLDCPNLNGFSQAEAERLQGFLNQVFKPLSSWD